jgi:hypothetical protein
MNLHMTYEPSYPVAAHVRPPLFRAACATTIEFFLPRAALCILLDIMPRIRSTTARTANGKCK